MFRFEERQRKQYVECKGPGPHVTKNGSSWLVVGLHDYVALEDGTIRCKSCAERTGKKWLPREDKPIGHSYLPEREARELRERLLFLQEYIKRDERRKRILLDNTNDDRRTEQTARQGKL